MRTSRRIRPLLWSLLIVCFPVVAWSAGEPSTSGEASTAAEKRAQQGIIEIIFSGGPIGIAIMLVLIGLSITATYLVIENFLTLRRKDLVPTELADEVRRAILGGDWTAAESACRATPCLLSILLQHGISEIEGGWSAIEKALEDSLAEQSARLFRKIEYLSVLANIAPMVGLLGTVVGMVMCFHEVAVTQGSAGAAELAEGIYQALVTTVAGLIIAIPSMGAFAILRNRVDELIADAAYAAQHALSPLKRNRPPSPTTTASAPPPPPASLAQKKVQPRD